MINVGRNFEGMRRERNDVDQNIGSIKIKIPSFQGKKDPNTYM